MVCKLFGHKWQGCKCTRCGETRDTGHDWRDSKCVRCGKVNAQANAAPLPGVTGTDLILNFFMQTLQLREDAGTGKQGGSSGKFPLVSSTGLSVGGMCDVCGGSLATRKAYFVPNDVFYHSRQYINWCAKIGMSEAMLRVREQQDTSPGSAICENCIHMFE
jgi:hypothetical protein